MDKDGENLQIAMFTNTARMSLFERTVFYNGISDMDYLSKKLNTDTQTIRIIFSAYNKYAPGNIILKDAKFHTNDNEFIFVFSENRSDNILRTLHKSHDLRVKTIPVLSKFSDETMLTSIIRAVMSENKKVFRIKYQGLTSLNPSVRNVVPYSIYAFKNRFHLRAYCLNKKGFRDFVFSRILEIMDKEEYRGEYIVDSESLYKVELEIIPHPKLSDVQKKCIELEYNMKDGKLFVCVPRSILFYFLEEYNLADKNLVPPKTTLYLVNRTEIIVNSETE